MYKTGYFLRKAGQLALSAAAAALLVLAGCSPEPQNKAEAQVLPNEFGQTATQMGIKTCAPLVSVLGQTLIANSAVYSAKLIPDKDNSDQHGLTAIVGQTYVAGKEQTKGAAALYAAPVNGACEGILVRTLLIPKTCADIVQQQLPKGTQRQDDLAQTAVYAMPEGGYVMMFAATPASCVVTMSMTLRDK
ncbi:MAG: hypothetical protein DU429_06640 [Candidatus Tokpelaia sp.]|uniref:hypothetical protein n=1 Tax=Candidatus Tokpelaia sp. TaxID=2233777 RepID=UPI00123C11B3|nr:hypothetical protein [Candidatus Tokpelaia sp.]KAA6205494.1 MAG: hypothetical protein DU430_04370 [Candidatus Tokpelaia sp.]KAA6206233.1 MAG: hypothetical protein DU429_06640 [Candidatus Tokpelaia sp.]KAA6406029.1 hypothetical protein DPQ22_00815 [Candidatus Tokpelaia sp.]